MDSFRRLENVLGRHPKVLAGDGEVLARRLMIVRRRLNVVWRRLEVLAVQLECLAGALNMMGVGGDAVGRWSKSGGIGNRKSGRRKVVFGFSRQDVPSGFGVEFRAGCSFANWTMLLRAARCRLKSWTTKNRASTFTAPPP